MRSAETVEKMQEGQPAGDGGQVGHSRQIHDLLHAARGQKRTAGQAWAITDKRNLGKCIENIGGVPSTEFILRFTIVEYFFELVSCGLPASAGFLLLEYLDAPAKRLIQQAYVGGKRNVLHAPVFPLDRALRVVDEEADCHARLAR